LEVNAVVGTKATKRIPLEPVTRIEGHAKVSILLDDDHQVMEARMHVTEFRGFERFIKGRPFWEVPVIVQRLCGICPVSHHLAAAKAMDRIVGADELTPTAEKIRRLMHHGQILQSHALHFFHLASPDLLFGFEADPRSRNIIGLAKSNPSLAKQGVLLRKYGQEIICATAGKKIHGTGAVPGGINKNLSIEERDNLLEDLHKVQEWARSAVEIARNYTLEHLDELRDFGSFESNYVSLVRPDGSMDLYDGNLRALDASGKILFDNVAPVDYARYFGEEVRSWSYLKFPFIRSLGPKTGWYRVGPLARLNTCESIDTPQAKAARSDFMLMGDGKPIHITMAYHWARMIELLHAVEKIEELLHDPDLQGQELVVAGERRDEAVGLLEAPRGTLFHHYRVDRNDQVTMANLIVATTNNNEPMNRSVEKVAREHISGQPEVSEGMLNSIEVAIRAYDPCLSCATHAFGRMPLVVELVSTDGQVLASRAKS
jgi:NAD-reducing hydrogenase large subunit